MDRPTLGIIIPSFNEEKVVEETSKRLLQVLDEQISQNIINPESFLYFIDDGSTDNTWLMLTELHKKNSRIKGLKLSRNFGHQNALVGGLLSVRDRVDCVISIDADLQQDELAIPLFLEKYLNGADIVFGIRKDRSTDSIFKKTSSLLYYKLLSFFGVKSIKNHADYRLISRKALDAFTHYNEVNLFLRGIFLDLGFKTDYVYFDVKKRFAGRSKYSIKKMFALALDGVLSFSIVPLRLVTLMGFVISIFSFIMIIYVLYILFISKGVIPGWASTVLPIYFLGGIQIMIVGLIGEYIGKIYKETKARPRFIKDIEIF